MINERALKLGETMTERYRDKSTWWIETMQHLTLLIQAAAIELDVSHFPVFMQPTVIKSRILEQDLSPADRVALVTFIRAMHKNNNRPTVNDLTSFGRMIRVTDTNDRLVVFCPSNMRGILRSGESRISVNNASFVQAAKTMAVGTAVIAPMSAMKLRNQLPPSIEYKYITIGIRNPKL